MAQTQRRTSLWALLWQTAQPRRVHPEPAPDIARAHYERADAASNRFGVSVRARLHPLEQRFVCTACGARTLESKSPGQGRGFKSWEREKIQYLTPAPPQLKR